MLKEQKCWAFSLGSEVTTGGLQRHPLSGMILSILLGPAGSAPQAGKPLRDQLQRPILNYRSQQLPPSLRNTHTHFILTIVVFCPVGEIRITHKHVT